MDENIVVETSAIAKSEEIDTEIEAELKLCLRIEMHLAL